MKKMVAALLVVCIFCVGLVGCAGAPKEIPITLPHNENLRFDMTKDELIANDGLETQDYGYYERPRMETIPFLEIDCIVTYTFSEDTLNTYAIGPMGRSQNYNDEYKKFVTYFTKRYGKGQTILENAEHNECKDYKQTNWNIDLESGVTYKLEVFTCAETDDYCLIAYFSNADK